MTEQDAPAADNKNSKTDSENNIEPLHKWTVILTISAFVCCIGSAFPAGYNLGVVNNAAYPMINFLNNSMRHRTSANLSPKELSFCWSSIVSIFLVGGVTGSLSAGYLADRYGRKGALMIGNASGLIGGIALYYISFFNAYELFWIGRIFAGFSGGLATSLVPLYVTEIGPTNLRGSLGVTCQLGITAGILVSQILGLNNILGTDQSWPLLLFLFAPLCFIALLITIFLPESPKYLYVKKQYHDLAYKELSRLRNKRVSVLKSEIEYLNQEAMINFGNESWSIWQVFRSRELRMPLFLVCLIQCGQQFSGINAVFYYSVEIFVQAGINLQHAQIATICVGLANFLMALSSVYLLSRFGRKIILLTSCYIALGSLTVLCIAILFIDQHEMMPWLAIVTTVIYVIGFGIGLGPISYFIGSEIFEVGPRSAAMAVGSVCNWAANFFVAMFFPQMQSLIGPYTFLLFVLYLYVMTIYIKKYLPETKDKTPVEVARLFTTRFS